MALSTVNALKALEERRKKEEERRNKSSNNQTSNAAKKDSTTKHGVNTLLHTGEEAKISKIPAHSGGAKESVLPFYIDGKRNNKSLSTANALASLQKRREASGETVRKFPAVANTTAGKLPTSQMRVEHDANYWQKRFEEEAERLRKEHAYDPGFPAAAHAIGIVEEEKKREEYITKHQDNAYDDDFWGQFAANYRIGAISEKSTDAMAEYLRSGDKADYEYSLELDELAKRIQENNKEVYADDATLPWISQDFAGYLPQFFNQTVPQAIGGTVGAGVGAGIGSLVGPEGTAIGAKYGAKAGATVASGYDSYDRMKASAFKGLIELGADEETARAAANDEAVLGAITEMGDTWFTLSKFGYGAVLNALGKDTAKKTAAEGLKKFGGILAKYGLNIEQERAEEGIQGAISIANKRRVYNEMTRKADEKIGQYGEGNIDLYNRPQYKYPDGMTATVESVCFTIDGEYVLLPSIDFDAKGNAVKLTDNEAFQRYVETGEYLGKFKTQEEADAYAQKLHLAQEYYYSDEKDEYTNDGLWGLTKDAGKVLVGVDFGTEDDETINEIKEQKRAGGVIAAVMGLPGTAVDVGANAYVESKRSKVKKVGDTYSVDTEAVIQEGLESDPESEAHKIAQELQTKLEAGEEISNEELGRAVIANEIEIQRENRNAQPTTLEEAAEAVVNDRESDRMVVNTEVSQEVDNLPIKTEFAENEPIAKPRNETTEVTAQEAAPMVASTLETRAAEIEDKAIKAAYELGRKNTPREKVTLATSAQEEAYNAGRIEHIKNMPKETEVTNIDSESKQAYNVSGKMTDKTINALDKKAQRKVVGVKDGRAYISDGMIAIPIEETDVEYAKSGWGLKENENIARFVEETANNEYVSISSNPVEGKIQGIGSVYLFTTEDGREIAVKKKYAKYFDGYNLSATFANRMTWAIKATDADGNFAGLVMGIRPSSEGTYNLTETKEVSMKSFKNKPATATVETEMTYDNRGAVLAYKGGGSYNLNAKLRAKVELDDYETKIVKDFDSALESLPDYEGTVYRNLGFDVFGGKDVFDAFVAEHIVGEIINYPAYTSSSKSVDGYPVDNEYSAHIVIRGKKGKDISSYGIKSEEEVTFARNTQFFVVSVESDGKTANIVLEEVVNENRGNQGLHKGYSRGTETLESSRGDRTSKVQQVQKERKVDVRTVPERDTESNIERRAGVSRLSAEGEVNAQKKNSKDVVEDSRDDVKSVETKTKLNDFGEKIGGARKDQWNSRGLLVDDLESMNDRERDKNVKKDNVWKRPNYRALVEAGGDRGLLWAVNEVRKSLQQNVYYGYNATAEIKAEKQKLFVETIRAIQSMAENAKTKSDFEAMGEKWLIDNGFLEDTGRTYSRYAYTKKFTQNPALAGSNYLNNIRYIVKNFDNLTNLADRNQFAVDTKSVVPKGFSIVGGDSSVGSKLVNGEWVKDTSYAVAKGRSIIKDGFATKEEALEWLKQGIAKKKGKTRFVPQQLLEVKRKGPNYRNGKSVSGQDYIDSFGFKGGEFGNWMSSKDRQVSLDYGFDALKDLADALGIEDTDISFGGNLNIAFGARGQGLSGAAAHYENERRVINLTKMNGAGSLGHEWFHALDDFIGGYTNNYATDKYYSLPEKTKQAVRDLITTMQYKDATQEETDLAKQKKYEQAVRGITYTLENEFKWVEAVEKGTFKDSDAKYYKKTPTIEDAKKYRDLFNKLIETGEMKYVEALSDLRKEVNGRVIPKETRDSFVWRLTSLKSTKADSVQLARKMTDFYTDSRRFGNLHSKDGDYWDSTVEMSARAFACYVADKTNKQNDYLTAHSDSAITLDADKDGNTVVVRAYPVGEERVAINKAFDNLIEALKEDGFLHERTQTEKPADVSYEPVSSKNTDKSKKHKDGNVDYMREAKEADHSDQWTAERVGDKNKKPKSLSEIIEDIRHDFGVNITTGHIRGNDIRGTHTRGTNGIRTKKALDLPTIAHELGHEFDEKYGLRDGISEEMQSELVNQLEDGLRQKYPANKLVGEGIAEYVRKFLQNRETAAIDYPLFTDYFLSSMTGKELALIEQLADEVNAYYALDVDTATSSIKLYGEKTPDARTFDEKVKDKASVLYQAFMDVNHGIKQFDRATGANTYKIAANAAYSDAIAGNMISGGDLTDANGKYVAPGLMTALHGLDLNNKADYLLFGEYLTVKHGPERLKEGMRTFSDDRKNSTAWMNNRQAEIERLHPEFVEISERLYEFWNKFMKTWAVNTGLVSETTYNSWRERWEYYVPFNRVVNQDGLTQGAKKGFANQNSTIKKARGSGKDIIHPVDNMIANLVKMVNAAVQNNVAAQITTQAKKLHADAAFMEQVPMPLTATKMDMTGIKEKLTEMLDTSDMGAKDTLTAMGIVDSLDDVLMQYGRGKAHGDVIFVLKNGQPEAWKINDPQLLHSLVNMSPKTMDGVLDAYAVVSRFMTANITGNNLIWSIFSNFPRDMMTLFTYSKNKNPVKVLSGVGSAYINKAKGDGADPLYKEFLALGGGQTSVYTAERDLAKSARKKMSRKAGKGLEKFNPNPLDWIGFVGNTVESGPRFATYKLCREKGMNPQEAFYEAMDITVNFRRGGRISRELNKVIPFFNANMQGLDKFRRWITAEELAGKATRKKAIISRATSYVAVSAALAAIFYGLNNSDDEKEKEYEQLSNYIKNSYWNIPIGDGQYFAIPKPREIGVLSSFFETCMEYGIGDNDHAFDEFYAYASENFLPAIANDIAQVGSKGIVETGMNIIGSLGIVGVVGYLGANRDFLGRPIVSSGLQNLEPKDQYTERTSKIAYWLGQAFNGSPQQIDYFFQQVLGGWWKTQKALFPVGGENVDYTLGVRNTYIKDNQYSTDLTNWLYDRADTTARAKKSNPTDIDKAISAKWDSNMTSFYGMYYKQAKNKSDTTATRGTRQLVLDMILEYQKGIDNDYKTKTQEAVERVCKEHNSTEFLPSVMPVEVTDGNDKKHTLSDVQYVEYQTEYLRLYWESIEDSLPDAQSKAERAQIITAAKKVAKEQATARTLKRIGAPASDFTKTYGVVSNDHLVDFFAGIAEANEDNSVKQAEVVNVISSMDVTDDEAWALYLSRYDSKYDMLAEKHNIPADTYMNAKIAMSGMKGKDRRQQIERYLNSVCDSYKEYLFLLGMEYKSIRDDYDYVMFFGEQD